MVIEILSHLKRSIYFLNVIWQAISAFYFNQSCIINQSSQNQLDMISSLIFITCTCNLTIAFPTPLRTVPRIK